MFSFEKSWMLTPTLSPGPALSTVLWCISHKERALQVGKMFDYWKINIKMGWSGENFYKTNIFMNPPDAGYNPFAFRVSN